MTITRTRIRCRERACPWRDDWDFHEVPWCRGIEEHECFGGVEHQHWPKRSQGGKEIVALLCSGAHDRIDNRDWGNAVKEINGKRVYMIWDLHGEILYERGVAATGEGEDQVSAARDAPVTLPSPAAPAPSDDGEASQASQAARYGGNDSGSETGNAVETAAPEASPPSPGAPEQAGRDSRDTFSDGADSPVPPAQLSWDSWAERGKAVRYWVSATPWAFGDWANLGEDHFGEKAWDEITEGFDRRDFQKVRNWMWVARAFPVIERSPSLSWSHHRLVAHLPPSNRTALPATAVAIAKWAEAWLESLEEQG